MNKRPASLIDPTTEEQLLEDIAYCSHILRRANMDPVSAASIVDMRKTQLEKLILAKHTLAINKRKDRDIWYTRDPRDASRKISATTKNGLYQNSSPSITTQSF